MSQSTEPALFFTLQRTPKVFSLFVWESLIPTCVRPACPRLSSSRSAASQLSTRDGEQQQALLISVSVPRPAVLCMWDHCDQLDGKINQLMH